MKKLDLSALKTISGGGCYVPAPCQPAPCQPAPCGTKSSSCS